MNDERPDGAVVTGRSISKAFGSGPSKQQVLQDVSLSISGGSFSAIVGRSGSGKSTLLNIIAGLETADSGEITVCGANISNMSQEALAALRLRSVGLIFQFFNLLPTLTLAENVAIAGYLAGDRGQESERRAKALLEEVGLGAQMNRLPNEVSGGETQRAAIARALMNSPKLLLADEPTGSLDRRSSDQVLEIFQGLMRNRGVAILLVTHDPEVERAADRVFHLADGRMIA